MDRGALGPPGGPPSAIHIPCSDKELVHLHVHVHVGETLACNPSTCM